MDPASYINCKNILAQSGDLIEPETNVKTSDKGGVLSAQALNYTCNYTHETFYILVFCLSVTHIMHTSLHHKTSCDLVAHVNAITCVLS